ncbi:hypothetical protein BaRGS_00015778 [Batillaria attramentaria]|uniref:Uncharacterized protein n=1 Tax=Batillaria attramentaria TaxID=370345 RepID=A0ABD0L178_9CAEN
MVRRERRYSPSQCENYEANLVSTCWIAKPRPLSRLTNFEGICPTPRCSHYRWPKSGFSPQITAGKRQPQVAGLLIIPVHFTDLTDQYRSSRRVVVAVVEKGRHGEGWWVIEMT